MINTVSIVGCGALGMMYASQIQKSLPNGQVRFIADRERLERYRHAAFEVNGARQTFTFEGPDRCEPVDLLIFTVKYNHLREAIQTARSHIGENTIVLSFLNGITSEKIIAETVNPAKVIPSMVAGMDATKTGYAVHFTQMGYIAFGAQPGNDPRDLAEVAAFFDRAGLRYERKEDINRALWWKFVLNIGINQCTALLRSSYGPFQTPGYAENMMRMAINEACAVARRAGIDLTDGDVEDCVKIVRTLSPNGKTSMCQDIEARRPTEVDMFAGTLGELGKAYGVPTPVNDFLLQAIKAMEN